MDTEFDGREYIDEKKAAAFLGVSPRTMQSWRVSGEGPAFRRYAPRMIRYRYDDLIAFAESKHQRHTSEYKMTSC